VDARFDGIGRSVVASSATLLRRWWWWWWRRRGHKLGNATTCVYIFRTEEEENNKDVYTYKNVSGTIEKPPNVPKQNFLLAHLYVHV
jgi:hypothetical protein